MATFRTSTKGVGFAFIKTWNMLFSNESNYAHTKINKRNKMHSTKVAGEITRINLKWDKSETENTIKPSWEHRLDCVSVTLYSPNLFFLFFFLNFCVCSGFLFCFVLQWGPMYPRLVLNSLDRLQPLIQSAVLYRHVYPDRLMWSRGSEPGLPARWAMLPTELHCRIVLTSTVSYINP